MKSKPIALSVFAFALTCLAGRQLIPEGYVPASSSFDLLPHDHSFYWTAMANPTNWQHELMTREILVRTNEVLTFRYEYPIDTNATMREFFSSERDVDLRSGVLDLIWDVERTNALPFFDNMLVSSGWHDCDRQRVFFRLVDVPRYWEGEPRHGMTTNEIAAIRATIESVMNAETNWDCRTECDRFFLATDPVWKTSEVRRAYLEGTLLHADSDFERWETQNRLNQLSIPYDLEFMRRYDNIQL